MSQFVTALEQAIAQTQAELVFSPLHAAPPNLPVPQVLYALDLAPWETEPGKPGPGRGPHVKTIKRACANARAIVVSSEYLRKRCLELFEAPLNKVVPALPGVDSLFVAPQPAFIKPPYLFSINDPLTAAHIGAIRATLAKRIPVDFKGVLAVFQVISDFVRPMREFSFFAHGHESCAYDISERRSEDKSS